MYKCTISLTLALEGWEFKTRPRSLYPWERDAYLTVHEAGWNPGPFWTGTENSSLPGFDPRIFQPLASRYTDCAIPAHLLYIVVPSMYFNFCFTSRASRCHFMIKFRMSLCSTEKNIFFVGGRLGGAADLLGLRLPHC